MKHINLSNVFLKPNVVYNWEVPGKFWLKKCYLKNHCSLLAFIIDTEFFNNKQK